VIVIHVTGPATGSESAHCFLQLVSHVVGGGTATYCLTDFRGSPGPNALVRVRGSITFKLPHRAPLRANVLIVDRFAADGKHARQTVTGKGISGGGTYVEDPPGHVSASDLRYLVRSTSP
jgi:hypothetical protein